MNQRSRQIRTLVWREWRQVRSLLLVFAFLLTFPWIAKAMFDLSRGYYSDLALVCRLLAIWTSSITLGMVAFGQEFTDGTMKYLFTRPVRRRDVVAVKLCMGLFISLIIAILAFLFVREIIAHDIAALRGAGLTKPDFTVRFRSMSFGFTLFAVVPVGFFSAVALTFKFDHEVAIWLVSLVGAIVSVVLVYHLGWAFALVFIPAALAFHLLYSCPLKRLS